MENENKSDLTAITERAIATGFLKADGKAITLAEFKKSCTVMDYGNRPALKRIYFGAPCSGGMLSLFPDRNTRRKPEAIKEAYDMLISILVDKKEDYLDPYYIRIREKYSISYGR